MFYLRLVEATLKNCSHSSILFKLFCQLIGLYILKSKILLGEKMKLEELIAPCPKCGSKDKIAHRKMLDNHRAHAEMETVKCEECGYIFFVNENMNPDEKKELLNELNKIYG